jgi:hypothetical protein
MSDGGEMLEELDESSPPPPHPPGFNIVDVLSSTNSGTSIGPDSSDNELQQSIRDPKCKSALWEDEDEAIKSLKRLYPFVDPVIRFPLIIENSLFSGKVATLLESSGQIQNPDPLHRLSSRFLQWQKERATSRSGSCPS